MSDELRVAESDGIATLTIDRTRRRNALSRALLAGLADAVSSRDGSALRAIVLEGAGDCFSAGADLDELDGTLDDLTMDDAVAAAANALRTVSVPVVAAIEGPCVGAAVELAMACDVRVASSSAFFEVPAVRLGILYNPAAVARLHRQLPPHTLTRLLLLGERLDAEALAASGVVAAPATAQGRARDRACELARLGPPGPWPAAQATKRLLVALSAGPATGIPTLAAFEADRRRLAVSEDRAAALAAARTRRPKADR